MPTRTLVKKLLATSAITDLLATNSEGSSPSIRPGWISDQDSLSAITYSMFGDSAPGGSSGANNTRRCIVQLNLWAATYLAAKQLRDAVAATLDGTNGTNAWTDKSSNPAVSSCLYDGGGDIPTGVKPGQDVPYAYGIRRDYILWYFSNPS